jgi:competence ComEA-like helix-hairpin-helix protein
MVAEQFSEKDYQKDKHFFAFGLVIFICLFLSLYFSAAYYLRSIKPCKVELDSRINPNRASVESLERLPGIGSAKAQAIVSFRKQSAGQDPNAAVFQRAEDLQKVNGIGPKIAEKIKPFVKFE